MKAVFFHDAPLYYSDDNMVYSVGFKYDIWKRYLKHFENLVISTRYKQINKEEELIQKLLISSGPNVIFNPITKYSTNYKAITDYRGILEQINESLRITDCAIIRLPSIIGTLAFPQAKKLNKPTIIELVACPWDALWNYGGIKGKITAPILSMMTKQIAKKADYILYVTSKFLQKRYPTNGKYIACSDVAIKNYDEDVLNRRISKILNKDKKNIIIGTAAAIDVRYKGQQHIIRAIANMKKRGINVEYHIAGPGNKRFLQNITYKYGVAGNVKFYGAIPHHEMFAWLDDIDLYIQPSKQEGLPRSVIEAMSRGCPILVSNTGGMPELVDKECIFPNFKAKTMSDIIEKSIKKDWLIDKASKNFNESKKYLSSELDIKRNDFFEEFTNSVKSQK
jgi:glycosyltransferase involved in cell wall biosynthesis